MRLNRIVKTIGFRLALLYAGIFGVSVLLLLGVVYIVTSNALRDGLNHIISAEIEALTEEYDEDGLPHLKDEVEIRLSSGRRPTTYYLLLDPAGQRLAGSLPMRDPVVGWHEFIRPTPPTGPDDLDHDQKGEHMLIAFGKKFTDGSFLLVAEDRLRVIEAEEAIFRAFGLAFALIIVSGFGGGILLSTGFLRRVDEISRTAQFIVSGNLHDRIPTRGTGDELDRLAQGLNEMFDRLQALIESLRQVSNDIAHDLRTPLSRLRQKLEAARARSMSVEGYTSAVDLAISDVDAILQTFAALLRIAQIEAGTRKAGFSTVDLSILFRSICETYSAVAEDNGQFISADIEDGVLVHGDKELLTQMLVNLVENAIRHCPPGTTIYLGLKDSPDGIVGIVSDTGSGIPAEAREKVFRRFYRLESSRTTAGNGLGLSLVSAVAELHHIQVTLQDNRPGLIVRLAFPSGTTHGRD
ncbi:HAMP domain-containing sensor histidine kinase [uncultured Ferrovibrio sp.]|jgi:Signal transduction histidine kinase|uniref:sensor histidine kinase n=1 Tax=uncultured Ferrovibrio sp. TaxID=1576913 RepID=UPI002601CEF9|nr:HAMP domain-containing sensor histidine kinase [uncultured Ferrovibrio sp.]